MSLRLHLFHTHLEKDSDRNKSGGKKQPLASLVTKRCHVTSGGPQLVPAVLISDSRVMARLFNNEQQLPPDGVPELFLAD